MRSSASARSPTLIEWDNDLPPVATLLAEAAHADRVAADVVLAEGVEPCRRWLRHKARMRAAIIDRKAETILPQLTGGRDPTYRLSIHQRHYEASLAKAIVTRFPAMEWLLGSAFIGQAASAFVRQYPPVAPCIAEYGEGFPRFLAGLPSAKTMPWIARRRPARLASRHRCRGGRGRAPIGIERLPRLRRRA